MQRVADLIDNTSEALFNAIKYCYMIADDDFYNINVRDIFKVALSNITNPTILRNLGFTLDNKRLGEMGTPVFDEVLLMIRYSFALRLPFIKKYAPDSAVRDVQIKQIYDTLEDSGFANPDGIIEESFKSMQWLVKTKKTEPPFDTEWFRSWIYTYSKELATINNRNMFLLGCADALFPLYYSSLQELLIAEFNNAGAV